MPSSRLTVVLSQGQSQNPAKRGLEEDIAAALIMEPGVEVSIVPHLYDLTDEHTGMLFLRSVKSDMVVVSWLFARAAHWVLDRWGVKGQVGTVLLKSPHADEDDDESDSGDDESADPADKPAAIGAADLPNRRIYSLDLRDFDSAQPYLDEIRRIVAEGRVQTVQIQLDGLTRSDGSGTQRGAAPASAPSSVSDMPTLPISDSLPLNTSTAQRLNASTPSPDLTQWIQGTPDPAQLARYLDPAPRRWHPVIDFSRCTNCMECIDFCLFGVYGVDGSERILVDQPDNCRKGCPACSRVCPEHAIIFPMHKSPEIAGAPGEGAGGLKIDLSKLFGGGDAIDIAASERDTELVAAGREAVGLSIGIPKRQTGKATRPKDDLDSLMDQLDAIEL